MTSARMVCRGPHRKQLRPEDRRCTLIIKNSSENQYLRQKAVRCLADHEIGTHFVSLINHIMASTIRLRLFEQRQKPNTTMMLYADYVKN